MNRKQSDHDAVQARMACVEWLEIARMGLDAGLGLPDASRLATSCQGEGVVRTDFQEIESARFAGASFSAALAQARSFASAACAGRVLAQLETAHARGSPVAVVLTRQRDSLLADLLAAQQDRAGRLPVKMLVPLALCAMPAFLLAVCAPLIAAFLDALR